MIIFIDQIRIQCKTSKKNSKIPNGETEIVKSEDKTDRGQRKRNEKTNIVRTHYTEN